MVSLSEKSEFLESIPPESDLSLFRDYLAGKPISPAIGESTEAHKIINSLYANDSSFGSGTIEEYSKKQPSESSHYIYNDLLVFLFICFIKRFDVDSSWLKSFVETRVKENNEKTILSRTFSNILNDNLKSNDGYFEVIIVYSDIITGYEIDDIILDSTYSKFSLKTLPFYDNEFLNLISIRAIDLIIARKSPANYYNLCNYQDFVKLLDKRIKLVSRIIAAVIVIAITLLTCWLGYKYYTQRIELFNLIVSALGFFGIGIFTLIGTTVKYVEKIVRWIFSRNSLELADS